MRATAIAACAAALAILAGGCGGAGGQGPGGADSAAAVVPSDALAFLAARTDLSSSDWHGLGTLVLQQLQTSADELRAVADGEVDVALLAGRHPVAFVQPADEAKLASFAKQHHDTLRRFGGWTAIAPDAVTLDAVAGAKTHLADNTLYLDAMSRLPADALVRGYMNGEQAHALFASIPGQLEARQIPSGARFRLKKERAGARAQSGVGTQEFRWLAAAATSSSAGLKLQAFAASGGLTASSPPHFVVRPTAPYVSGLVDEIPSGALAVLDMKLSPGALQLLRSLPAPFARLFGPSSSDLATELDAVLGGETAIYVRSGLPAPEVTLVTQPVDTSNALTTIDRLIAAAPADSALRTFTLQRAIIGGQLVVSTSQAGIDAFRSGGAKLSDDPSFLEAKKESGMPDATTGFVFVNAKTALPLLELAGVKVPADLPELSAFTAFGAQQQNGSTLTAFLGVR